MPSLLPKPVTDCLTPDAVTLEVFRHLLTALTEEMGVALQRASFSPNIKEGRDHSCALFSTEGVPVALGDHLPVHLGAIPMRVQAALDELGDVSFPRGPLYTREGFQESTRICLTPLTRRWRLSNTRIPSVSPTPRYAEEAVERGATAEATACEGTFASSERAG